MKKSPSKTVVTHSPSLQEGELLGDGWRIKERKTSRPANSARHNASLPPIRQRNASEQSVCVLGHDKSLQRRHWCHPFGGLASMGVAVVALMMMAGVPSSWLIMRDDSYQLHLGTYRSELGARLVWAGLEADSGTQLDDLDPSFKRQQSESGIFYRVLAGKYERHRVADSHCARLREHEIVCSVVGG